MKKLVFSLVALLSIASYAGTHETKEFNCSLDRGSYKGGPKISSIKLVETIASYTTTPFKVIFFQEQNKSEERHEVFGDLNDSRVRVLTQKDDPDKYAEIEIDLLSKDGIRYEGDVMIQGWYFNAKCVRKDTKLSYPDAPNESNKKDCPWGDDPDC